MRFGLASLMKNKGNVMGSDLNLWSFQGHAHIQGQLGGRPQPPGRRRGPEVGTCSHTQRLVFGWGHGSE